MIQHGVIIGRFQVAILDESYRQVIDFVRERHKHVTVILAESTLPGSMVNPLSFEARKKMLYEAMPDIDVFSIKDHPLDEIWSQDLDSLVTEIVGGSNVVVYGSRSRFINLYTGNFTTRPLPEKQVEVDSAIREKPASSDFRQGMVHAFSKGYPKVFPTVDIALFRDGRKELLLGKKEKDKKWRLIGGFADPEDNDFEEAAKRELREECGEMQCAPMGYEGSFKIDDWRYRNEKDKIISTLFSTEFISGNPSAGDDIAEIRWFSLSEVAQLMEKNETAKEHNPLFSFLLKKYQ